MSRCSGILLHISSLPGPDGIGSMGREAFAFADFLKRAGVKIWQVLPLGPTGYGESPYQSASVFAGNPMLISLEKLREEGLLTGERTAARVYADLSRVDFDAVRAEKEKQLRTCFSQSAARLHDELAAFEKEAAWVRDYALYCALKAHFGNRKWTDWPDKAARNRHARALKKWALTLKSEVSYQIFVQYLFFRQWRALKKYCNEQGISIFGDMPIYVAEDSADTWTHPEVFQLDLRRVPKRVAGVPPDAFSEDGQLWGNPLYRWWLLKMQGYRWWVDRMRQMGELYDIVRVDHFIGFANYYSIPYGANNARNGKWVKAPGQDLFTRLKQELPELRVVAEDLGEVTDAVRELMAFTGYPGMRVMHYAFGGGDDNCHLPANYVPGCVAYTGTHDNDTTRGWAEHANPAELEKAKQLLGFERPEDAPAAFIRALMESAADTVILPMQDVLGLGGEARMNLPGTTGGNWAWRMLPDAASGLAALRLRQLIEKTGRTGDT